MACNTWPRYVWSVRIPILLENVLRDAWYAFRMSRKNPGFTAIAVLTVALGVGSNTATSSVVKAVLLNQLPYRNPDRVVALAQGVGGWTANESRAAIREIDPAGSNGKDRPLAAGRPPDSVRCPTRTGARRRRSPRWPTKGRVPSANAAGFSRAADGRLRGARHLWRHLLHGRPAHARDGNPNAAERGAILRMVLKDVLRLLAWGLAAGLAASVDAQCGSAI